MRLSILLCCCIFVCCIVNKHETTQNCRKAKKELKTLWINTNENYYEIKNQDKFVELKSCLYGLNTKKIVRILGEPNEKNADNSMLLYYISPKCNERPKKECSFCQIEINTSEDKVVNVGIGTYETG